MKEIYDSNWKTIYTVAPMTYTVEEAGTNKTVQPKLYAELVGGAILHANGHIFIQRSTKDTADFRIIVIGVGGQVQKQIDGTTLVDMKEEEFVVFLPNNRAWDVSKPTKKQGNHTKAKEFVIDFESHAVGPQDLKKIVLTVPYSSTSDPGAVLECCLKFAYKIVDANLAYFEFYAASNARTINWMWNGMKTPGNGGRRRSSFGSPHAKTNPMDL